VSLHLRRSNMHPKRFISLFAVAAFSLLAASSRGAAADGGVTFIPAGETAAAFAKGRPLVETSPYKVHASRRDAPGQAEVHDVDTDILYVLEGSASIVTGGEAIDARDTAPNEKRGASIRGGATQRLVKGDVIIIPSGVPHQFTEVQAPFLYYAVKVTGGQGGSR
jgi:mannose-6-phosphate isomerase-like protein (cupin superfamily)